MGISYLFIAWQRELLFSHHPHAQLTWHRVYHMMMICDVNVFDAQIRLANENISTHQLTEIDVEVVLGVLGGLLRERVQRLVVQVPAIANHCLGGISKNLR